MKEPLVTLEQVGHIRQLSLQREQGASLELEKALKTINRSLIPNVRVCLSLHEALLFLLAYPFSKEEYKLVEKTMYRLKTWVETVMRSGSHRQQMQLSGSGLPGTLVTCQFSYPITRWLSKRFPADVSFHSASGDPIAGATLLHQLFPRIEYGYTTQGKMKLDNRLRCLTGKEDPLKPMLYLFEKKIAGESTREILFDSLQVFTTWQLNDEAFNRSFIRMGKQQVYFHKELIRKPDIGLRSSGRTPAEIHLSKTEQVRLLDAARASLAFYSRETETITLAEAGNTRLFHCGRGLSIALFGIRKERRLSLESYIGYMAIKNQVPIAYGGAWIFGERCKIGLNVYPPFRKGESALLFTEIVRLYQQLYNIQRFVVMPYQFGKGNKEGIESAAFWFYYKLGFRPQDHILAEFAEQEWKSSRRSDAALLKRFTRSNLELRLKPRIEMDIDPERISRRITEMIVKEFGADRHAAALACKNELIKKINVSRRMIDHPWMGQLGLLCKLIPNIEQWPPAEKKEMRLLPAAWSKSDEAYIRQLQHCIVLQGSLADVK